MGSFYSKFKKHLLSYRKISDILAKIPVLHTILMSARKFDDKIIFPLNEKFGKLVKRICMFFVNVFLYILRFCYIIEQKTVQSNHTSVVSPEKFAGVNCGFQLIKKMQKRFIIMFILFILVLFVAVRKGKNNDIALPDTSTFKGYVAEISIDGVIMGNEEIYESLKKIRDNKSIKAVILKINSPGGGAGASEKIYTLVKKINKTKPVVISMQEMAASGGYMISLAGRYIFATRTTITGSIGVFSSSSELIELAKKLGMKFHYTKSSPIKGSPQPFEEYTDAIANEQKNRVGDFYRIFREMVLENRNIGKEDIDYIANGQVFLGERALKYRLIDKIGDEEDAFEWLKSSYSDIISKNTKVKKVPLINEDRRHRYGYTGIINSIINSLYSYYKVQEISGNLSY